MARILIADDGIEFDGNTARERPLGGVESSIINLAGELAKRGHEVSVRNMCHQEKKIDGVFWAPLVKNVNIIFQNLLIYILLTVAIS